MKKHNRRKIIVLLSYILFFGIPNTLFLIPVYTTFPPALSYEIPSEQLAKLYALEQESPIGIPLVFLSSTSTITKKVALTFDADLTKEMRDELHNGHVKSWYNDDLITVLKKHDAKATLFVTGLWAQTYTEELKMLARDAHFEIGNHSYDHHAYTQNCYHLPWISDDQDETDISKSQEILTNILGKSPTLFRFPGLCHDTTDVSFVAKQGLVTIDGDVTADDGFTHNTKQIVDEVLNGVENGSIIVAHMNGGVISPQTDEAMDQIIPVLKEKGFTLVTVSELLHLQ